MIPGKKMLVIWNLHHGEGINFNQIAQKTGHAHETVEKICKMPEEDILQRAKADPTPIRNTHVKKFGLIKPYFDDIDSLLSMFPNVKAAEVFKVIRGRGYPGSLTSIREYLGTNKVVEPSTRPTIKGSRVLAKVYMGIIEKHMRKEHPWISENDMFERIKGTDGGRYQGRRTMMSNFMREIRPSIIDDLIRSEQLAAKFKLCVQEGKTKKSILTRIARYLIRNKLLKKEDIADFYNVEIGTSLDPELSHKLGLDTFAKNGIAAQAAVNKVIRASFPKSNGKAYVKIKAFKVLEDGALFETETDVLIHLEELKMDKNIDAFTATLPDIMSNDEVNVYIKRFAREGL